MSKGKRTKVATGPGDLQQAQQLMDAAYVSMLKAAALVARAGRRQLAYDIRNNAGWMARNQSDLEREIGLDSVLDDVIKNPGWGKTASGEEPI